MLTHSRYQRAFANHSNSSNGASGVYANFSYGADRQRKQQTAKYVTDGQSGIETTIYVFGLYEYETTPAQTHNKYFIQVPGGTQIIYDIQSVNGVQTTYITGDHLGSGNLFLSASGTKQINESYSAYGYRRTSTWSGPLSSGSSDYTTIASTTRRGYTDALHELLDNLNLIHMNGRVYDPVIGRFMSPDPVVTQIGDSQRGNPYSYVNNNPLTFIDPTGMSSYSPKPIDPCGVAGLWGFCGGGGRDIDPGGRDGGGGAGGGGGGGRGGSPPPGPPPPPPPPPPQKTPTQCNHAAKPNKSQLAFTSGLQGGGNFRLGPAKFGVQANFGRQEWNAVGPNTVSRSFQLNVDIVVGRAGLQATQSAVGTWQPPVTNFYGQVVQPGVSVNSLLYGQPWEVQPIGEFRGLDVTSDLVVGFDLAALIGVNAQLDLGWLAQSLEDLLNGC